MRKIVHFHPDARMARLFVGPLMEAECAAGYCTELVSSVRRLEREGIVIPFDLCSSNLLRLPFALLRICAHLNSRRPDVLFSHNTKSSLLPLLGGWLCSVKVRVYFNHGVPYVGYSGVLRWLLRFLEWWNCALATHVVTVSKDMILLLQDVSPRVKPRIINNGSASGIDLMAFSSARLSRVTWRQSYGVGQQDLVVAYVGRPERRKGFELVLRLWADHILEEHIKLILCGPQAADVFRYLSFVPPNVIVLGFVNNVVEVLSASDMMILPSEHEGLSYACMEAQAAGAVVVANDISGIRCVIEDGVTGYLIQKNDSAKYIELIRGIYENRSKVDDVRLRALISVSRFSRDLFLPAYRSFLDEVMQ